VNTTLAPQHPERHAAVLPILVVGWLALFGPSYAALADTLWTDDTHGHGPLIGAVVAWLLWRRQAELAALPCRPAPGPGALLFIAGLAVLVLGRSQAIPTLEMLAQGPVLAALLLLLSGRRAVRAAWFPLMFLLFMVPWPASWVEAVTQPMKSAVSAAAVALLHALQYPVGQAGVVITAGPYQLLVADACAGLNSLFTLEALGLLYMSLVPERPLAHKVALALAIPALAFAANVVRVLLLVLVTFHGGEAAGRGFAHDFASIVMFGVALVLVYGADRLLCALAPPRPAAA